MAEIKLFTVGFLATNCYVVTTDGEGAVIVDAGGGFDKIKSYLDGLGKKAVAVLCTHGHFDHVYDAHKWQKYGAKIYIHSADVELLRNEKQIIPGRSFAVEPTEPDVVIEDGDVLKIAGMVFETVHTPGHSKGSVCFVLKGQERETVFTGDTVFYHSYGRTDFYGGNFDELISSVEKIVMREADALFLPGHGESTTAIEERNFNPILRNI